MKTLIILTLITLTACQEGFYAGEASHTEQEIVTTYQQCYFPESMTIQRSNGKTVTATAGDTILVSDADKYWWCKYEVNSVSINLNSILKSDTVIVMDTVDEHFTTAISNITHYGAGVCTVSVDWLVE